MPVHELAILLESLTHSMPVHELAILLESFNHCMPVHELAILLESFISLNAIILITYLFLFQENVTNP